jgi:multiple sugar transport system permease protein
MSVGLAFTDQRLISPLPTEFVGLRNFIRLFSDKVFFKSIGNNFAFVIIVVPVQTALALLLAILVDRTRRFSNFFRMIYFMPVVVPMIVVSVIWYFMYNPSIGLINRALGTISFGMLGKSLWLQSERAALPAIMILSIWQGVGFQMVIYLAGLQDVPQSLYEAATVDGASPLRTFWSITLPQLRNTTIFIVVSTTILAFQLFTQVKVMTNGGPNDATSTTVLYIYNQGFKSLKVGYAAAASVLFIIIVLAVSLIQRRYLHSNREVD